jgi:acetyl-CoA C-acetyltransferase
MKTDNNEVYILGSSRVPFFKSLTAYSGVTRKELMIAALEGLVKRSKLQGVLVGDTALGALINSSTDWNLARECLLSTELHPESPAYNVQRACGTSLDAIWQIALKIHTGAIDLGIGGGVDTNSDLPIEIADSLKAFFLDYKQAKDFNEKLQAFGNLSLTSLKPKFPTANEPRTQLSMGEHCELMVKEWQILREAQDKLALQSHLNAAKAYQAGFYEDLIYPFKGLVRDGILRENTSLELLAKLKPAFDPQNGSLTAGNSSPLTDGAACVLLGNKHSAEKLGLTPLAKLIDVQVAAVDFVHGAGLLMAPTKAVSQLFTRNQLSFQDFDYLEIHEAFAGQVLCNLKAWESESYCEKILGRKAPLGSIDRNRLNVVGSSLALGHPYAATGARIAGTLAKLLSQGGNKRGLISICTAGGMGVAAILESA